jgi:hypothetical protein
MMMMMMMMMMMISRDGYDSFRECSCNSNNNIHVQ